jgi:hypothetical protein
VHKTNPKGMGNSIMIDKTGGLLDKIKKHADSSGLADNLKECLCKLERHGRGGCTVTLYPDFALLSLYFEVKKQGRLVLNGGMIYHGSHDSGGNGSSPTFSVSLTTTTGWAIHT